jgi:pectinesterase
MKISHLFVGLIGLLSSFNAASQQKLVVAKDGTGNFTKVQDAFDAVPEGNNLPITIFIKKGIYKEVLVIDARKNFITIIGEEKETTILTVNNKSGNKLDNHNFFNMWSC